MKSSGTIYVGATFALLAAYFSYQWWFNPSRALKRQMGEVAAALSVPAGESDVARIARLAQLGRHLADNVRVRAGDAEISSRDSGASGSRSTSGLSSISLTRSKAAWPRGSSSVW